MAASKNPQVIAYHLMWTTYGWWLPNDPRGSTSRTIRSDLIAELGELHFGRKKLQPAGGEIRAFYTQAGASLKHPLLKFSPAEFPIVAAAIGAAIEENGYACYAAAVMPDHVHVVIRKHRDLGEAMVERIQTLSRKRLVEAGLRQGEHPVWTRGGVEGVFGPSGGGAADGRVCRAQSAEAAVAAAMLAVGEGIRQLAAASGALAEFAVCSCAAGGGPLSALSRKRR